MTGTIFVVIPFFQRKSGLLARALEGVRHQAVPDDFRVKIMVVDDASPVSAASEIIGFEGLDICILEQPVNRGAAAARNAALDAIGKRDGDCDFVAFLDSDDCWAVDYLATSKALIGSQIDLCISNCLDDDDVEFFSHSTALTELGADSRKTADPTKDWLTTALITDCFPHTSFIMYRWAKAPELRFDANLRNAGEDHLFFFGLARRCDRAIVNFRVMGARGRGVSLYRSALSWDHSNVYPRLMDQIASMIEIENQARSNADQRALARMRLSAIIDEYVFLCARNLTRHGRSALTPVIRRPAIAGRILRRFPVAFVKVVNGSTRRRLVEHST
jgi:succinoglycan biosynthesis protein ExoW